MITVALPVYNSNKIAWLCLESLCRQHRVDSWELVVFEELHPQACGELWLRGYEERLREVGCVRVLYLTQQERISLSRKWVEIAKKADGEFFVMCAADNYYSPFMLRDIEDLMDKADWIVTTKGYFYDFNIDKIIHYNFNAFVGLQMSGRTEMIRQFPEEDLKCGIDTWFSNQMINVAHIEGKKLRACIEISEHWQNILCTNGLNNISSGRHRFFKEPQLPFYPCDKKLDDIVPADIAMRLRITRDCLRESKKVNDDYGYNYGS